MVPTIEGIERLRGERPLSVGSVTEGYEICLLIE